MGHISSHPNEGENIPRHSRLQNKHGNEGRGGRFKNKLLCGKRPSLRGKQLRVSVFIGWMMVITGLSVQQRVLLVVNKGKISSN